MTALPLFSDDELSGPVTCLGMTFESDDARREYFLAKLRAKLQEPEFRGAEGFPIGTDEDILALSDPPYYTACPNPFLDDLIQQYGEAYDPNDRYHKEPFAADVSEGKSDAIYNAHGYHTKVPHKAIMRYILHYTDPGDLVLDGFCGTGMTGIAAQLCADRDTVRALGYTISDDGTILDPRGETFSSIGARYAFLNDLSPAATFIAYNYNAPAQPTTFVREAERLMAEVESECGWMYQTAHTDGKTTGRIIYTIWSDVFLCSECGGEIVFWDAAIDTVNGKVRDDFPCPHCGARQTKRSMKRVMETKLDSAISQPVRQAKQVPVRITYTAGNRRFDKKPDQKDLRRIQQIEESEIPYWFPTNRMPEGDEARRNDTAGITHVHHFYTRRNLWTLSAIFGKANLPNEKWALTSILQRASKQHQIAITRIGGEKAGVGGATAGHRRGTLYVPSNQVEFHPLELLRERIRIISASLNAMTGTSRTFALETASATAIAVSSESVDYVFVDPPFGGNIMYSELNFIWESWLRLFTNNRAEAITSNTQGKVLGDYQQLMLQCFREYYRLLKPGRWMTIEFHNSQNKVWVAIQEALEQAGFVVADVRTLDKQLKTHTQRTAAGSVNQDLVISAYKPNSGLEARFTLEAGTEDGVWDFVRTHLRQLPIFVTKGSQVEVVAERLNYLLFDRMVAFHVQRGVTVPISAAEFYAGLVHRFAERDGMYFLPEQVADYDKKRTLAGGVQQLAMFVTDEVSALEWLRQSLSKKPQTYSEIYPAFVSELRALNQFEKLPELAELLQQSYIRYDGVEDVPSQIHAYLASNYRDLRGLSKSDARLRAKAKDRWYVPDPNKAADLAKLREAALLREFGEYQESQQKRLKVFRLEALRVGFRKAWQNQDYTTIVTVANKIPEAVLQEDPKLIMWYDQALMRLGHSE